MPALHPFAIPVAAAIMFALATERALSTDVESVLDSGVAFPRGTVPEKLSSPGSGGEGPAWDPEWGLLSSGRGHIYRRSLDGTQVIFRENAGTNGLLFDSEGRLLACEPKARRVTRTRRDGTVEVLTDSYDGHPYNQPNDIALDSKGRIYFSDACYGGPQNVRQRSADGRSIEGVYRIDAPGKIQRVLGNDDVERANGVLVSADDRFLFVADNCNDRHGGSRKLLRFVLREDGTVEPGSRKVLYDWRASRGPDGIKQDVEGRLYVAGGNTKPQLPFEADTSRPGGIYVFDPRDGTLLQFLPVPTDEVTNCAFGGPDGRDLFITAGGTLYRVPTTTPGRTWWPRKP
jgi:sugar lactone lactonase YvrE